MAFFVGAFSGLIALSHNVSATGTDHYWIGTTTDSALNTNWQPATVPSDTDAIYFSALSVGNCSWTLSGNYGSFNLLANFTHTITQAASFSVTGYSQAGGTLTGSISWTLTDAGSFNHTAGIVTAYVLKLRFTGVGTFSSVGANIALKTLEVTSTGDLSVTHTVVLLSGATITGTLRMAVNPGSLCIWDFGSTATSLTGIINGPGQYIFAQYNGNYDNHPTWGDNAIVYFLGSTNDQVATLVSDVVFPELQIGGDTPGKTMTLDLSANNYALSAILIKIIARGALNARAGKITVGNWNSVEGTFLAGNSTVIVGQNRLQGTYGNAQTIFPNTGYHVANAMTKAPNGDYLAFVRFGTSHVSPGDYAVMKLYRSTDQGVNWFFDSTLIDIPNRDVRNYAAGTTSTGRVFVFTAVLDIDTWTWGADCMKYLYSDDSGHTWSSLATFTQPTIGGMTFNGSSPYGNAQTIGNNRFGVAYYGGNVTHGQCRFAYSDDNGMTWTHVALGSITTMPTLVSETAFTYLGNSRVLAMARVDGEYGYEMFTSINNGATWTDRGRALTGNFETPPMLLSQINANGEVWALLLSFTNYLTYSPSSANDIIANGTTSWASDVLVAGGDIYGRYATSIFESFKGEWVIMMDREINATRCDCRLTRITRDSIMLSTSQQFHNLTINQVNVKIDVATGGVITIARHLTVNDDCSFVLRNESIILDSMMNNGVIYQIGNELSISGSNSTPLVGYGVFDGNIILNGGLATNYQIQTGLPMGHLHTDRDTKISLDASHYLRVVPSTVAFINISMTSLMEWTIQVSDPTTTLTFTLSGLESGRMYRLYIDGNQDALLTASGSGVISFTYSGPWSEHQFEIVATSITGSISPLVNLIFIMFAIGVVVGVIVEGTYSLRKKEMLSTQEMIKSVITMVIYIVIGIASLGVLYSIVA